MPGFLNMDKLPVLFTYTVDGYPMEDVEMRWRVGRKSIVGLDNINLPQFTLVSFNTLSTIQELASGNG